MAFVAAYEKALITKNIFGGFCGTGIHPFLLTKVLHHVTSLPLSQQSHSSTSLNSLMPFNKDVLTDSRPISMQ